MTSTTPSRRFCAILLAALALGGAAAGCGGEDQDFVDGYNTAVEPLEQIMTNVNPGAQGDKAQKALDDMAAGLERVRTDIAALDAPGDAQDEVDRLLGALDKSTDDVRKMSAAVGDQDLEKLQKATTEFSNTGTELVAAETALRTAVEG